MIVDLSPTEDQVMIRSSVAGLLSQALPIDRLHRKENHAANAEINAWENFAQQGLFGLAIPVDNGGVGYSAAEEVVVCNEFGRHLISPSVMASMLAAQLASEDGLEEVVQSIISGERRAAFSNPLSEIDYRKDEVAEVQLIDGSAVDYIILIDQEHSLLFDKNSVEILCSVEAMDETIEIDRIMLPLNKALIHLKDDYSLCRRHTLMLSAYLLGMTEATKEMAVEYAKIREQFGQPIGKFQAIKHICADMSVRAEAALAQTFYAGALASINAPGSDVEATSARLITSQAAMDNAKANIQVHGGMGFSAECSAHYFLKRAHIISSLNINSSAERLILLGGKEL